jgi:hypothetical protein
MLESGAVKEVLSLIFLPTQTALLVVPELSIKDTTAS